MNIEAIPATSRADWLALRRRDVTASDVAALFGAHPYRTILQVYADKTGTGTDRGDNAAMRRGRILEPAVAEAWYEERGERLTKATLYLRSPEHRVGATPDYLTIANEPVECKTAAPEVFERDWAEGPPLAYVLQCLVQVYLTGAPRGWIALMIDNRAKDFFVFDVPRNDAAWERIIAAAAVFWRAVDAGEMPAVDYSRDAAAIKALYPRDNGATVDLSGDNMLPEMLAERARLKDEVAEREDRLEAIDTEIKAKMGEAATGTLDGYRITYKLQNRKEVVIPATSYRVLRITKLKEKDIAA